MSSPERAAHPAQIVWAARPSLRGRLWAQVLRAIMRPRIAFAAAVSGLGIRLGPTGIEMWAVWSWFHRATDLLGRLAPPVSGSRIERVALAGCPADYVRAPGARDTGRAILYFHGGGFVAGGLGSYRRFTSVLSSASGATILNVGYRLLPRSPIAHAIEDGLAGYRQLLADGFDPARIVIAGDSAGGGLAFLVAAAVRAGGLRPPAGLVALSPWADLNAEEKLLHPWARRDPVIPIRAAHFVVEKLVRKGSALDPELSPVNLDVTGFPPTLIHVGTTEVLALDAIRLTRLLENAGVPVTLKYWHGQVHDFQVLGLDVVPEARQAVTEIGCFVGEVTETTVAAV